MRMVHLTASTFFGGPERQLLGLAEALRPDVDCRFLLFREGNRGQEFADLLTDRGFDGRIVAEDTPRFRACLRCLTHELEAANAGVLFCHGYKANLLGRIAARRVGIPAVAVSRGWTWESRRVGFYNRLDRLHLKWMDHVVAVSEGQATKVRDCGVLDSRLTVIRNSARLSAFQGPASADSDELRKLFPVPVGRVVLAAGRFSPEKGFDVLIDAAAMVVKQDHRTGFVLFGEGDLRPQLEKQIALRGLADRFLLPGFTHDLDTKYGGADVVALSSYTEGLPNVLLEASAAGVPIVATIVGGVPEVVFEGDTGFLVEPGNARAMAQRLIRLLWDEDLRRKLGDAGRVRMQELFTFEAQADAYRRLIDELLPAPLLQVA